MLSLLINTTRSFCAQRRAIPKRFERMAAGRVATQSLLGERGERQVRLPLCARPCRVARGVMLCGISWCSKRSSTILKLQESVLEWLEKVGGRARLCNGALQPTSCVHYRFLWELVAIQFTTWFGQEPSSTGAVESCDLEPQSP